MDHEVRELILNPLQGIGQICLGSSEWLIENVTAIDQSLKEFLILLEHDAELQLGSTDKKFPKHRKPLKLPELISRVKEMSNRSHELADYYQKIAAGDLGGWNQLNNEQEIYKKSGFQPIDQGGMSPDASLSAGSGISSTAPNEDSECSLPSYDSDSESCNSSPTLLLNPFPAKKAGGGGQTGELEMLLKQFSNYEEKLKGYEEKNQLAEDEIVQLKSKLEEAEAALVKMSDLELQLVTSENRIRLYEKELEGVNMKSLALEMKIVELEANMESEKIRVEKELENEKMKSMTLDMKTVELEANMESEIKRLEKELETENMKSMALEMKFIELEGNLESEKKRFEEELEKECTKSMMHEVKVVDLETNMESEKKRYEKELEKKSTKSMALQMKVVDLETNFESEKNRYQKELERENRKSMALEMKVVDLEANLESEKKRYEKELEKENTKSMALEIKVVNLEANLESEKKRSEKELEKESTKSMALELKIVDLEGNLESERRSLEDLKECNIKLESQMLERDSELQRATAELQDALGSFAIEKWQLETSIATLSEQVKTQELTEQELNSQCESLAATIMKYETEKLEEERYQAAMKRSLIEDIECLKDEIEAKNTLLHTLNENLHHLKLNHSVLEIEKDALDVILKELRSDLLIHQEQLQGMTHNVAELQNENVKLTAECDQAKRLTGELSSKIDDLENEVANQAAMINDTAEGKREAIRQLSFSLDYFKSAYEELRSSNGFIRKPTTMVF